DAIRSHAAALASDPHPDRSLPYDPAVIDEAISDYLDHPCIDNRAPDSADQPPIDSALPCPLHPHPELGRSHGQANHNIQAVHQSTAPPPSANLQPLNLPTFQPANLPTSQPPSANLQPLNLPTFQPSNLPTSQPPSNIPQHPSQPALDD